jgi:hypothetical protein
MAKNTETTAPATTAPATTAPATTGTDVAPVKKDTVKIKLPLTKTERDNVLVGLNGTTYLIKRGVEVEVPRDVAKILENSERMLATSMEFEAELAANANKN